MAEKPQSLTGISDIPLSGAIDNVIANLQGRTLTEPSVILIALNRETVDVTCGVSVGATQVLPAGSAVTVQATVGVMPVLPDDIVITTAGLAGDEIIIAGRNADAAVPRELRTIVKIIPVEDMALLRAVQAVQGVQLGV